MRDLNDIIEYKSSIHKTKPGSTFDIKTYLFKPLTEQLCELREELYGNVKSCFSRSIPSETIEQKLKKIDELEWELGLDYE